MPGEDTGKQCAERFCISRVKQKRELQAEASQIEPAGRRHIRCALRGAAAGRRNRSCAIDAHGALAIVQGSRHTQGGPDNVAGLVDGDRRATFASYNPLSLRQAGRQTEVLAESLAASIGVVLQGVRIPRGHWGPYESQVRRHRRLGCVGGRGTGRATSFRSSRRQHDCKGEEAEYE